MAANIPKSRVRARKDKKGFFFIDCRPWGPRIYGYNKKAFSTRQAAEIIQSFINSDLAKGLEPEVALAPYVPEEAKLRKIRDRIDRWMQRRRQDAEHGDISQRYLVDLERFSRLYFTWWDDKSIHEINYANLDDWSDWLLTQGHSKDGSKGMSPRTKNKSLQAFSAFCKWLERREEIPRAPRMPYSKYAEYKPTLLEPEMQEKVLAAIPYERRGIFLALAHGLRHSEARALDLSDFTVRSVKLQSGAEIDVGFISVTKGFDGDRAGARITATKNRQNREVPIDPELQQWIETQGRRDAKGQLKIAGPLFINPTAANADKRWLPSAIKRDWYRAIEAAGAPPTCSYEGTKHSTATRWLASGVSLETVKELLGHRDLKSSAIYAKIHELSKVAAVRGRA